jgi:hypothetical protein
LDDIGRNYLLGQRKKIAKFLMRTFTCSSTVLYDWGKSLPVEVGQEGAAQDLATEKYETILVQCCMYDVPEKSNL